MVTSIILMNVERALVTDVAERSEISEVYSVTVFMVYSVTIFMKIRHD